VQDNSLLLIALFGFAIMFLALGALIYFFGWRYLTFGLIGGLVSRLLGGREREESAPGEEGAVVVTHRLDSQTAIQQLPDFHATVAQYRNQEKLTPGEWTAVDETDSDVTFTTDPESAANKDHHGVRYSSDSPNRLLRDRRYERVRGPDSGHDPEVHNGMFESDDK
jgi:hypothetical protein